VKTKLKNAGVATAIGVPAAILTNLPPIVASYFITGRPHGFTSVLLFLGLLAVWMVVLGAAGLYRLVFYRVWRPGFRPCMCDMPTYCLRHRSPSREHHRPGVVRARLAESEDA
jgi:hypothetical protein